MNDPLAFLAANISPGLVGGESAVRDARSGVHDLELDPPAAVERTAPSRDEEITRRIRRSAIRR